MGNFIGLEKLREVIAKYSEDALRYYLLRAAPFGADLDWSEKEFNSAYFELSKKLGNCLNRTTNMTGRYRGNTVPAAGELQDLDRQLMEQIESVPGKLSSAYQRYALQECAMIPIELVRAIDGYIEATAPFKLAKDPAQSGRLDTVLQLLVRGMHAALVGLLPILPEKAAGGLRQLGVVTSGRTLGELFASPPAPGQTLGEAAALFPQVDPK
jgi:methionyl-tRNA synthetase